MDNIAFGTLIFDTGWKTKMDIVLFEKPYSIIVKAKAYYEKDGITKEQEEAFSAFKKEASTNMKTIENLLTNSYSDAANRFLPTVMLFERDGAYALLFDDAEDLDDGIAVTLAPKKGIVSQDDYL